MTLPTQTSFEDAQKVCSFLRTKATGSTQKDTKAVVGAKYFDSRKLAAYEAWGVLLRQGDLLKATPLGRELGGGGDAVAVTAAAQVLLGTHGYRMALEYLRNNGIAGISAPDLGAWWHEHVPADLGTTAEKSISSAANSFFSVAAAAWVGEYIHGGKHGSARLDSINLQRIAEVLDATLTPPRAKSMRGTLAVNSRA